MFRCVTFAVAGAFSLLPLCAAAQSWGTHPMGAPVAHLGEAGDRAVVLFFVASGCPVSNRTFPEMQRLREHFADKGVRTWYVYPNTDETAIGIEQHQRAFDARGEAIQDPAGSLVRLAHAVATPEMAVLVPDGARWRPVYVGRIDNRYVRLGLERPAATEHFGEAALDAVLAGKQPAAAVGNPVGCAIMNPAAAR